MQQTLVLVADAARFLVYKKNTRGPLELCAQFSNEAAHSKVSELGVAAPGRTFARGGQMRGVLRHSYSKETDPREQALEQVVGRVCVYLDKEKARNVFGKLVLIAPDSVMGKLRSGLAKPTQAAVTMEHVKDLAWLRGTELVERVESLLKPW